MCEVPTSTPSTLRTRASLVPGYQTLCASYCLPLQAEFNKAAQAGAGVRTLRKEPIEWAGPRGVLAGRSRTGTAVDARKTSGPEKHSLP